jgi:hypothetical protein
VHRQKGLQQVEVDIPDMHTSYSTSKNYVMDK